MQLDIHVLETVYFDCIPQYETTGILFCKFQFITKVGRGVVMCHTCKCPAVGSKPIISYKNQKHTETNNT